MRRLRMCVPMMLLVLLLSACGGAGEAKGSPAEELALVIRGEFLDMTALEAVMEVTADYGQRVYEYTIQVSYERDGETVLTLTAPAELAGITARIRDKETALETVEETELLRIVCRDPEGTAGVGQECSLWFDSETHALVRGELSQDGFTVIQCRFTEFARS